MSKKGRVRLTRISSLFLFFYHVNAFLDLAIPVGVQTNICKRFKLLPLQLEWRVCWSDWGCKPYFSFVSREEISLWWSNVYFIWTSTFEFAPLLHVVCGTKVTKLREIQNTVSQLILQLNCEKGKLTMKIYVNRCLTKDWHHQHYHASNINVAN